jgi:hypothetical protein
VLNNSKVGELVFFLGGMLTAKTTAGVTKITMQFMQLPLQGIKWHCVKNHRVQVG